MDNAIWRSIADTINRSVILISIHAIPLIAFAQVGPIESRVNIVTWALRLTIGILFIIATIVFLWGIIRYVISSADDPNRKKAKDVIFWGIIGMTIITVAWGIVTILVNFFGVPQTPPRMSPPVQIRIN